MLESVSLQNFRNHENRTITLGQQTVIVGSNGAGKTNVLEAIAMLSVTTSWRTERDSEVVAWDQPFTRVMGGLHELVVQRKPYYKRLRVDGVSKRVGEVVGLLPTILFQPDDSQLVSGSPSYRRQAIDRLLSQTDREYLRALTTLQKVLKQRNKLLKQVQEGTAGRGELDYWDAELARETAVIRDVRSRAIPELANHVTSSFAELVPEVETVHVGYLESPRVGANTEAILRHLIENREKEIAAGVTLYGPQREDITFSWMDHPAHEGMSRGQVRALALACKLAELRYLEEQTGMQPILLLDDIFSEFDAERRERVVALTKTYQSVLTTTDREPALKAAVVVEL